jgi:asparagine synthase (glutamine-hydrolysing)
MPASFPVVKAAAGPPLNHAGRRRRLGRIGGIAGVEAPEAVERLSRALGQGAQVLGTSGTDLVIDEDVGEDVDWPALLRESRLGTVTGPFALAWRDAEGPVVLARDAPGERTLFYAQAGDGLIFASTLRALLATGLVPRKLHLPSVATYLSYAYLPGRETLVEGAFEVLAGERVEFRQGRLTRRSFWSLPVEEQEPRDPEELRRELRRRLEETVRRRLPRGEAIGASLSGGIDSSLVVALARRLHDAPLKTYSISFGDGYASELPFSSLVAEHCRTGHRVIEVSPEAVVRHLDETIAQLSDPIGDPLTVPNALLFREAAGEVSVVLNGEGGDPCFGGPKNLPMLLAELYDSAPGARERSYLRAHLKCYDDLDRMLTPEVREALAREPLEERLSPWLSDPRWTSFVSRLQAINVAFKGPHHILPKVDALAAAAGVLPRSPLFDRRVVELSFAIPPQLKLKGAVEKYLLKEAVRDLLPAAIVDRPKSGMLVPVEAWFQGPLLPEARRRLLHGLAPWGIVERDYLEKLLEGRLGGLRPRRGAKLWLLLTLESWLACVLRS